MKFLYPTGCFVQPITITIKSAANGVNDNDPRTEERSNVRVLRSVREWRREKRFSLRP